MRKPFAAILIFLVCCLTGGQALALTFPNFAKEIIAGPATFTTAGKIVGRGSPCLILMSSLESPNKATQGSR